MGGGAPEVQGDWLRGVLLHDGSGGPGPVAEEDCRPHNQHRSRQPRETRAGQHSHHSLVVNCIGRRIQLTAPVLLTLDIECSRGVGRMKDESDHLLF